MKANELRIGNYVYFHGDVEEINMVDGFGVIGREEQPLCSIDEVEPIPLTEEWLLRFGFEEEGESFNLNDFSIELIGDDGRWCTYFFDTYHSVECSLSLIKYVHQLQNLYFALTGEELILN